MQASLDFKNRSTSELLDQTYTNINKASKFIDKAFNYGACIPIVGVGVSQLRMAYGKAQVITGLAILCIGFVGLTISSMNGSKLSTQKNWEKVVMFGSEYTIHGALNIVRGGAETLVGLVTHGFGNPLLIIPNMYRDFNPYFEYGQFQKM